jgi:hypothetical protein
MAVTPIPAWAGDLILWNARLAHGNGHNRSHRPRFAQYIALRPVTAPGPDAEVERQARVRQWREPPAPRRTLGRPRSPPWEQTHGKTAELTSLGRNLLGLDLW